MFCSFPFQLTMTDYCLTRGGLGLWQPGGPTGPVCPPARWAATSNVEGWSGTEMRAQGT